MINLNEDLAIEITPAMRKRCIDFANQKVQSGTNNNHYNRSQFSCIQSFCNGKYRELVFEETMQKLGVPCSPTDFQIVLDKHYGDECDFRLKNQYNVEVKGLSFQNPRFESIEDLFPLFLENQIPTCIQTFCVNKTKELYVFVYLKDLLKGYVLGYVTFSDLHQKIRPVIRFRENQHYGIYFNELHPIRELKPK